MHNTNAIIRRNELIEKINSLNDIQVKSIETLYQMEIEVNQCNILQENMKTYFNLIPQTIPKIIHQVWIGANLPPWQWIDSFRKNFMAKYPEWEYHLWRENDIADLKLINRSEYELEEVLSGKVNILRYELLYQFGGIYIDADSEWINNKPLQELIDSTNQTGIFAGWEDQEMLANGVIGCSPYNPIMYYTIKLLGNTHYENRIIKNRPTWISSGPRFFSEAILPFNVTTFPVHYFSPISWHNDNRGIDTSQFTNSYIMQYGYSTNALFNK